MSTATDIYLVSGMTCDHCERAVVTAVRAVPGVDAVSVDLASGRLNVLGGVEAADIAAAVREAGYEVMG